ncbi:MAG TPA: rhodanese-like domain-containing protein [Anaerolineae bacterium]|nr:rhodanese-like domain-containing protein [Anaerolineae bacterium]HNU03531.1 rhodanese-like domain-containing protein [Anaerolineae bacterium]
MALLDSIKQALTKSAAAQPSAPAATNAAAGRQPEPEPQQVAEIQAAELIPLYRDGAAPRLLDCREPFEWTQVRIPGSLHIPMNDIPARLGELDPAAEWVVVCAHGNRSVAVADYLLRHGLRASSLAGGVTDWWMAGGETESDYRR